MFVGLCARACRDVAQLPLKGSSVIYCSGCYPLYSSRSPFLPSLSPFAVLPVGLAHQWSVDSIADRSRSPKLRDKGTEHVYPHVYAQHLLLLLRAHDVPSLCRRNSSAFTRHDLSLVASSNRFYGVNSCTTEMCPRDGVAGLSVYPFVGAGFDPGHGWVRFWKRMYLAPYVL
jgi:hypothetical protein